MVERIRALAPLMCRNTYQGLHARHYDLVYADKPYAAEARFVHDLLRRRPGRLLDVACGTGATRESSPRSAGR